MTWAYPVHEAVVTTRLGIANAFVATAAGLLGGTVVELVLLTTLTDERVPASAFGAVAVLAIVVAAARWAPRWVPRLARVALLVAVLVVGAAASWLLAVSLPAAASGFALASASISLTIAASIAEPRLSALGALLGYVACLLGIRAAVDVPFDVAPLVVALVIAAFSALLQVVRARARAFSSRLDSAGVSGLAVSERQALELRSRALLHDTVLNELVALGMSQPGALPPATAASIRSSLAAARDSSSEPPAGTAPGVALEAILTRLGVAGLTVAVSGTPAAVDDLAPEARSALLLALEQCLTNVLRHAGVDRADLTIGVSGDRLVVTVADEGSGFDEESVPRDRFGFRESVRGRITQLGGTVRVMSSPGLGTAIVLSVPIAEAER